MRMRILRGVRSSSHLKAAVGPVVTHECFMPDERTEAARLQAGLDAGYETSINWDDDSEAIVQLRSTANAKHGVVAIEHSAFEAVRELVERKSLTIRTERRPVSGNRYHGNIVFGVAPKPALIGISQLLAFTCELV